MECSRRSARGMPCPYQARPKVGRGQAANEKEGSEGRAGYAISGAKKRLGGEGGIRTLEGLLPTRFPVPGGASATVHPEVWCAQTALSPSLSMRDRSRGLLHPLLHLRTRGERRSRRPLVASPA